MAYATNTYIGDGVTTQFAVSFQGGFFDRADVIAYVEDELDGELDQIYRIINWINDGLVELTPAPANGKQVILKRQTPRLVPVNDYSEGAILHESELDESFKQTLFIQQELLDEAEFVNSAVFSAGLADAAKDLAAASAAAAASSETAAAASEAAAVAADASAVASAAAALASEQAAAASETAAGISETNAAAMRTAAGISETNAAASASAADASNVAAQNAKAAAETAETAAELAETNAAASAAAAAASAASIDPASLVAVGGDTLEGGMFQTAVALAGTTPAPDFSATNLFTLTLTGNTTMAAPTNLGAGSWKLYLTGASAYTFGMNAVYKIVSGEFVPDVMNVVTLDSDGTNVYVYFAQV